MGALSEFYVLPKLRPNVVVKHEETAILLDYKSQGCRLGGDANVRAELSELVRTLEKGRTPREELAKTLREISPDVTALLDELDRLGLLTEGEEASPSWYTGNELYAQVRREIARCQVHTQRGAIFARMRDGTILRNQLVGYALEYYHVVRACPAILAPALSNHESETTEKLLKEFYLSEFNHEEILRKALVSIGIDPRSLSLSIPLSSTFALTSALAVYARQHPLSFKASLFLFEEGDMLFHELFVEECKRCDLPASFYEPLIEHAHINDEADHDNISLALLAQATAVSEEDVLNTLKHTRIMHETMAAQEREVLAYYGAKEAVVPRVFR